MNQSTESPGIWQARRSRGGGSKWLSLLCLPTLHSSAVSPVTQITGFSFEVYLWGGGAAQAGIDF